MGIGKSRGQAEQENPAATPATPGAVIRGQNSVHVLPCDPSSIAEFLPQALDRVGSDENATQLLVLTSDAESAIAVARSVADGRVRSLRAVPVTGIPRAMRLLAVSMPHVVAGTPTVLLGLIRTSALKLENVKSVVIAWADGIIATEDITAMESIMAEVPREAPRTIVTSRMTPAVEALLERYARRAGRVGVEPAGDFGGVSMSFVAVSTASRLSALRRLLDHVNPDLASIYIRSDGARAEVEDLLRALGYGPADNSVSVAFRAPAKWGAAVVLYELPASRSELRTAIGPDQPAVFAFVRPSQLPALRLLAGRGTVTPLTLPGPAESAAAREDAFRSELSQILAGGVPEREILALEPLLDEFDGVEIAAAALKLLQRSSEPSQPAAAAPAPESDASAHMVRIFVSAGKGDGVSPGDLVGAITAESGISSAKIGKIEIRERHSLVEIAGDVAEAVVQSVTGITIRGRRITSKIDSGGPRDAERGPRNGRDSRLGPGDRVARNRDIQTQGREGRARDHASRPRGREPRSRDGARPQGRDARQSGAYAGKQAPRGPRASASSPHMGSDRQPGGRNRPRE